MTEKSAQKDDIATRIMTAMVRMPPEPHKAAPKPTTRKGEAQRRRREKERSKKQTEPYLGAGGSSPLAARSNINGALAPK
jgi:hypothetical protein